MTERTRRTLLDLYRAIRAVSGDFDTIKACDWRIFLLRDPR